MALCTSEDGYLARYLGYSLAEGGDLTVRGSQVFLKTLGGLLPVDVILRRVPDEEADPLELKPDSRIGVPALVQAVREGQVAVANALGSGYLESPALMAFLPAICRALRGEDLQLPSVNVWWCGRPDHLQYVESHIEELVIRPAFRHRSVASILGWRLTEAEKKDLIARIRQRPGVRGTSAGGPLDGSGVERIAFGTVADGLADICRSARGGVSGDARRPFAALRPGRIRGRVGRGGGRQQRRMGARLGARQKRHSAQADPRRDPASPQRQRPATGRAADNLFWLGRFAERAESKVRHLRSAIVRLTTDVAPVGPLEVAALIDALYENDEWRANANEDGEALLERIRAEAIAFIFDAERRGGLFQTLQRLRRTGAAIRDRISIDSWRIVNQLHPDSLFPGARPDVARPGELLVLLNQMVNLLSAFSGLATESMTLWTKLAVFSDMGRRIERAQQMLQLLKRTLVQVRNDVVPPLEAVLEIADSTMTYRYRYLTSLQLAPVLDLMLADESNPRAVGFQLAALAEHVEAIARRGRPTPSSASRAADRAGRPGRGPVVRCRRVLRAGRNRLPQGARQFSRAA